MPHAPAGWYDYPGAPGSTRYWTGAAWLAPGVGPAVAAPGFAPQPTGFAPQPTGFAPQPEFRPTPSVAESPEQARPVASQYLQPQVAEHRPVPQEDAVTWDVVGMPRRTDLPANNPSSRPGWSPAEQQGSGSAAVGPTTYSAPSHYQQAGYSAPPTAASYGSARGRGRVSAVKVIASIAGALVIGFGVWWALGTFLGTGESAVAAASPTPSVTAQPSVEPSPLPELAIGPNDSGQLLSPSGRFTFLIDASWTYDSASVESADVAPGETPIGAWWTADPSTTPNALWVAISEYSSPGTSRSDAHQAALDAFLGDVEVTSQETAEFQENTGTEGVMTEVRALVNGTEQRCEVITIGADGHFLVLFIVGSDTDTTRLNAEGIRFFIAPTGD